MQWENTRWLKKKSSKAFLIVKEKEVENLFNKLSDGCLKMKF